MFVIGLQQKLFESASETTAGADADIQNTHISGKQCSQNLRVLLGLQYYVFFLRAHSLNIHSFTHNHYAYIHSIYTHLLIITMLTFTQYTLIHS